jgi:hypothetical protein
MFSLEIKRCMKRDLDDMKENLAEDTEQNLEPRGKGLDKAGHTFRKRIKVTLRWKTMGRNESKRKASWTSGEREEKDESLISGW